MRNRPIVTLVSPQDWRSFPVVPKRAPLACSRVVPILAFVVAAALIVTAEIMFLDAAFFDALRGIVL